MSLLLILIGLGCSAAVIALLILWMISHPDNSGLILGILGSFGIGTVIMWPFLSRYM